MALRILATNQTELHSDRRACCKHCYTLLSILSHSHASATLNSHRTQGEQQHLQNYQWWNLGAPYKTTQV